MDKQKTFSNKIQVYSYLTTDKFVLEVLNMINSMESVSFLLTPKHMLSDGLLEECSMGFLS